MKSKFFIARLARGAAATAMVSSSVLPAHQAASAVIPQVMAQELALPNHNIFQETNSQAATAGSFIVTMTQNPSAWDKKLEREFRKLALAEANGTILINDMARLEQLSCWRNQLLCPQTVDEILLQMKRDGLLTRMENLLQEYVKYVEFQQAASQAGPAS